MRSIRMMRRKFGLVVSACLLAVGSAQAQLLPGGLPLPPLTATPPLPGRALPPVGLPDVPALAEGPLASPRLLAGEALTALRATTAQALIRRHPRVIDAAPSGDPVVRGEVLALEPAPAALAGARQAGFRMLRESRLEGLGLRAVVLTPPRGMTTAQAVMRLRALDPDGAYEFNHLFLAGGRVGPASSARPAPAPSPRRAALSLGLVDGSAAARSPAFRGVRLTQRAFGPGGARTTDHATAVASLMAGPGSQLFVADVYGPTPAGGSADAIARALDWLARNDVRVVNISLVGPPNGLLAAAVAASIRRGHAVVAAVGNDGPSAPPLYPAAYRGVIGVTGVDGARRVLVEAGRGPQVDYAAQGADLTAAATRGRVAVRGTSFAAPQVARRLAEFDADEAALAAAAVDLGAPGRDPIYGLGLVERRN